MKRFAVISVAFLLASGTAVGADDQGWGYLIDKLVADGVNRERVVETFRDPRVAPFTGLEFSVQPPRESRSRYRRFLRPAGVTGARRCRARYANAFAAAERQYGVSADVLAAIFFVESGCGRYTGSHIIFYRLARLAMANAPDNLQHNIERFAGDDGNLAPAIAVEVRTRARYLEQTFYPEVHALFAVAERMRIDPLDLRGSGSGAFGYPQFLPSSYLRYGADGDGDGRVTLHNADDAAASCARYFVGHGWHPGLSAAERRAVVWQYNHSAAYVDTVLALTARIRATVRMPHPAARRRTQRRAANRTPPDSRR